MKLHSDFSGSVSWACVHTDTTKAPLWITLRLPESASVQYFISTVRLEAVCSESQGRDQRGICLEEDGAV